MRGIKKKINWMNRRIAQKTFDSQLGGGWLVYVQIQQDDEDRNDEGEMGGGQDTYTAGLYKCVQTHCTIRGRRNRKGEHTTRGSLLGYELVIRERMHRPGSPRRIRGSQIECRDHFLYASFFLKALFLFMSCYSTSLIRVPQTWGKTLSPRLFFLEHGERV